MAGAEVTTLNIPVDAETGSGRMVGALAALAQLLATAELSGVRSEDLGYLVDALALDAERTHSAVMAALYPALPA